MSDASETGDGGASAPGSMTGIDAGATGAGGVGSKTPRPYGLAIPSEFPFQMKTATIHGVPMAYVDEGEGRPVVFLHGNPTSSYLWRNIFPKVLPGFRAIAPDLIGMGASGKPDIGYTFHDHARYLDALLDGFELRDAVLVVHDWGSALGMRYARLNPERVRGLAFMEALLPPGLPVDSYEALGEQLGGMFRAFRTPDKGEALILDNNAFVEEVLPKGGVARGLTEVEMAAYRAPFPTRESRKPTLVWPRQIPIGGEPAVVVDEIMANFAFMKASAMPKICFWAYPGAIMRPHHVAEMAALYPNIELTFVGRGLHFLQEDQPQAIAENLWDWLRRLDA